MLSPVKVLKTKQSRMYSHFFKRFFDFCITFCALVVLSPFMLVFIIILHFANKGAGVFFTQDRPGKDARIFKAVKFKTMTDERDAEGKLLPDAQRITRVGRIFRSLSIDELPQLWNVLKGDMALVGPRPLLPKYLPLYSKEQYRRHEVRPGITGWAQVNGRNNISWTRKLGWAQVNGRNNISWTRKFELDVWYVDHLTMWLDIKILLLTVKKVFAREDIAFEGEATTHPFDGTN